MGNMTAADDRKVFSKMHWVPSTPDMGAASADTAPTEDDGELRTVLERVSAYYLREFDRQVPADAAAPHEPPTSHYLSYAQHITELVDQGGVSWVLKEWQNDTLEDVDRASEPYWDVVDVRIMHLVGKQMPRVFQGETTMMEEFRASGLLDEYYARGLGFKHVCR